MREPKVENKYDLTISKIKKLKVDRTKIQEKPFWRNNVVDAWCFSVGVGKSYNGGSFSSFWLGVYDNPSKDIGLNVTTYEDMCAYNFENFFDYQDIENELDLEFQEAILIRMNELLDKGVFSI